MTQQLDTNADAMVNTDASAVTEPVLADADAVTASADAVTDAEQALADALVNAMIADEAAERAVTDALTDDIAKLFDSTLAQLIALRDKRYNAAIKALDDESDTLAGEYGELESGIKDIEATLPARTRINEREIDELLVSGKRHEVRDKANELQLVKRELAVMKERLGVISDRFLAIANEKEGAAKAVVEGWLAKVMRPVIKVGEHGLLVTMLSGLEQSLYTYRDSTGIKIHQGHIASLTSDGRSPEFAAGHRWYG